MLIPSDALGKACRCGKCAVTFRISQSNTAPYVRRPTTPNPETVTSDDAAIATPPPEESPTPAPEEQPTPAPRDKSAGPLAGQLLVDNGLVTAEQRDEALQIQQERGGKLIEILVRRRFVDQDKLCTFLSQESGTSSIRLSDFEVPKELVSLVPHEFAKKHHVFPVDRLSRLLTLGMAYPLDRETVQEVERSTGLKVRAVLCKFDDIYGAIRQYYPEEEGGAKAEPEETGEDMMHSLGLRFKDSKRKKTPVPASVMPSPTTPVLSADPAQIAGLIADLDALPALPSTMDRVRQLQAKQGATVRDIVGIVSTDPSVVARMLSIANSAAYGMAGTVTNLNLAAALLGIPGTEAVVQCFEGHTAANRLSHYDYNGFWLASMFCSAAAMAVARESGACPLADAYTVGVLHEIGRLAFATLLPERCSALAKGISIDEQLEDERKIFGMGHHEAAYLLAKEWQLPETVGEALRRHHAPLRAADTSSLAAAIALAAAMTESFSGHNVTPGDPLEGCRPLLQALGIDRETAQDIYRRTSRSLSPES